ncbi:hypothetical protein BSZ39_11280 [Bowdeniella nasicola]|uniref:Uncharacterized protein n=1 Tax=Bowdeniella nasicola TaxID=208480 RepID=A0A1Q5Q073_9ACTO|nr:hypothetical protein [Bowdeniella nasicola]OKL53102.1 hypothetical protein BSZ39_11280 [Bowdeniella nasicola]
MSGLDSDTRVAVTSYLERRGLALPDDWQVDAVRAYIVEVIADAKQRTPLEYLTVTKAAEFAGVKRSAFQWHPLPRPDATFGEQFEGWLPETIEWWSAQRGVEGAQLGGEPVAYWGPFDVAAHLGIDRTTLARYLMPAPDGIVGRRSGWRPETIHVWQLVREGMKDPIADAI